MLSGGKRRDTDTMEEERKLPCKREKVTSKARERRKREIEIYEERYKDRKRMRKK